MEIVILKSFYILPEKLSPGDFIDLIEEKDKVVVIKNKVKLIKKLTPSIPLVPYPFIEKSIRNTINAIKEKWLVADAGHDKFTFGRESVVYIPVFYSKGLIEIKDENDEYTDENL